MLKENGRRVRQNFSGHNKEVASDYICRKIAQYRKNKNVKRKLKLKVYCHGIHSEGPLQFPKFSSKQKYSPIFNAYSSKKKFQRLQDSFDF